MDKIAIVCASILLGLFVVYVINNNVTPKPAAVQDSTLNLASSSPTPSSNMNLAPSPISSQSSKISQTNNIPNATTAVIKTERGDIELSLYPNDAPNTVNNFISKAKSGFYVNKIFHRVEDWVIQGGDPLGNGTGGGKMPTELNNKPFVVGSLGVARGQDIKVSNDAQFFITKTDASWLNNQYTNFGLVTKGIDVVNKIQIGDKILEIKIN